MNITIPRIAPRRLLALLLSLCVLSGAVNATEIEVLDLHKSKRKTIITVTLEPSGGSEVKLRMVNKGSAPILFKTNLGDLLACQFLEFPETGAFQLKSSKKQKIKIPGEMSDGWFYPNSMNSVIVKPKFSLRGAKPVPTLDDDLQPYSLGPGTTDINLNYQKVLDLINKRNGINGRFVRVKVNIRIEAKGRTNVYDISSNWFKFNS